MKTIFRNWQKYEKQTVQLKKKLIFQVTNLCKLNLICKIRVNPIIINFELKVHFYETKT